MPLSFCPKFQLLELEKSEFTEEKENEKGIIGN